MPCHDPTCTLESPLDPVCGTYSSCLLLISCLSVILAFLYLFPFIDCTISVSKDSKTNMSALPTTSSPPMYRIFQHEPSGTDDQSDPLLAARLQNDHGLTSKTKGRCSCSLSSIPRLITCVFALVAIVCLLIDPPRCRPWEYRCDQGIVAFPLVFLFLSLLAHLFAELRFIFTNLVYIELKGKGWTSPSEGRLTEFRSQNPYSRKDNTKKGLLLLCDVLGAFFLTVGISIFISSNRDLSPVSVAGAVFTYLTAWVSLMALTMFCG